MATNSNRNSIRTTKGKEAVEIIETISESKEIFYDYYKYN